MGSIVSNRYVTVHNSSSHVDNQLRTFAYNGGPVSTQKTLSQHS
jgi:hypothetical protein